MKKSAKTLLTIVLIAIIVAINLKEDSMGDFEGGNLEVHFIDVGQGDSILIKSNNEAMLIDGGTRGSRKLVLEYLEEQKVDKLKYLVASHPHEDHIGGLAHIIENKEIGQVIMPKATTNTRTFENLLDTIESKGLKIKAARSGDSYELDGSLLTILGPNNEKYSNLNNYSVVLKLEFGEKSFLFTGDAEALAEKEMIEAHGSRLRADLLKLGHHGSNTSSTEDFLDTVRPEYGIISAGQNNRYDHPDKEILDRLKTRGIKIYRTDQLGNIVAVSDGKIINFFEN